MKNINWLFVAALALFVSACGGGGGGGGGGSAPPSPPPSPGTHTVTITVTDTSGAPVNGLTVSSSPVITVTNTADGVYTATAQDGVNYTFTPQGGTFNPTDWTGTVTNDVAINFTKQLAAYTASNVAFPCEEVNAAYPGSKRTGACVKDTSTGAETFFVDNINVAGYQPLALVLPRDGSGNVAHIGVNYAGMYTSSLTAPANTALVIPYDLYPGCPLSNVGPTSAGSVSYFDTVYTATYGAWAVVGGACDNHVTQWTELFFREMKSNSTNIVPVTPGDTSLKDSPVILGGDETTGTVDIGWINKNTGNVMQQELRNGALVGSPTVIATNADGNNGSGPALSVNVAYSFLAMQRSGEIVVKLANGTEQSVGPGYCPRFSLVPGNGMDLLYSNGSNLIVATLNADGSIAERKIVPALTKLASSSCFAVLVP